MVPAVFSASAAAATSPSIGVAMAATLAYASNLIGPPILGAVASVSSFRVSFAMLLPVTVAILALANGQRRRRSSGADPPSVHHRMRRRFAGGAGAALVERISASSGNAESETRVISRKSFE